MTLSVPQQQRMIRSQRVLLGAQGVVISATSDGTRTWVLAEISVANEQQRGVFAVLSPPTSLPPVGTVCKLVLGRTGVAADGRVEHTLLAQLHD